MKIKELFTNANGELSTTNTIQMMSAVTLCIAVLVSLFLDRAVTGELALAVSGMATLTATSKGFFTKRDKEHGKD